MPMTDEVFDGVTDGSTAGDLGFGRLPGGFERLLAQWSVSGPVAYVEAEYFGGVGEQRAAVWADGALVLGPAGCANEEAVLPNSQPDLPGPGAAGRAKELG